MDKIIKILEEIRPEFDFQSSNDYIRDGMLDSFDIVTLVSMLEEIFGISIGGTEIIPDNFKNIKTIRKLVLKCGGNV